LVFSIQQRRRFTMLERVSRIAEESAWRMSESRRRFLGRVGQSALAVTGVLAGWLAAPGLVEGKGPKACSTNATCGAGQYCAKAVGHCKGAGVCQPRPQICPDFAMAGYVGCDGKSYPNPCYAARAGVNLAKGPAPIAVP
jgi:hypothetical protein